MAIDPKSRGLEPGEKPSVAKSTIAPKVTGSPTKIARVVAFGPGWMTVEMGDGNQYRRDGGTLAWRNNNPGNVKFGEFAKKHGAVGRGHNDMAVFPTVEMGKTAMRELLFNPKGRYFNLTIRKAISIYAPDFDGNDSNAYTHFICTHAKLSNSKVVGSLTTAERERMLAAMQAMEGSKTGTVSKVTK